MSKPLRGAARSVASLVALFGLVTIGASCGTTPGHARAENQKLSELCPDSADPLSELGENDACGAQLLKLTGSAACEAGNSQGCTVGAAFSFMQRNEGGFLAEDTFEERVRTAVDLADKGCQMGNERACMQHGVFVMNQDGNRADKIAALRRMDEQCQAGMGIVCHVLGLLAVEMSPESDGNEQAASYQKKSCDLGFSAGCWQYGQMLEQGYGVEANASRARELYQRACELKDSDACAKLGEPTPIADDPTVLETVIITSDEFLEMTDTACGEFRHACTIAGLYIDRGEVQTEREDLAFSYYERGCDAGAMTSCMLLAINYHQGDGVGADTTKAAKLARQACDGGVEKSCDLALEYEFRVLDEAGAKAQAELCRSGDARACYRAGGAYGHGANFPTTEGKAIDLNVRGCQLGLAAACTAAGGIMQRGLSGEEDRDAREANELFARGCKLGDEDSCRNLGVNLALGRGTAEDSVRAVEYFQRGCDLGSSTSCGALASYYFSGYVVDKDLARAESLHRKGCSGGLMTSCRQLAQILEDAGTDESFSKAVNLYDYACDREDGPSCTRLGELYGQSEGVDKRKRGVSFFERACLLEDQEGCTNLGIATLLWEDLEVDVKRGEKLLRDTCDGGYTQACIYLANFFRDGKGVKRNPVKAADLYKAACDAENRSGCSNLGWLILNDGGVDYRPAQGVKLFEKACQMGDSASCRSVHGMLLDGYHVAPQPKRAYEALQAGCSQGEMRACNDLADHLYLGLGVPRDADAATAKADEVHQHYANRCEEGGAICGFFAHSIAHRYGPTGKKLEEAREFLAKSCEAGEIWSCKERAEQMATGELYERDRDEALSKLRALCTEEGHGASCFDLAFFAGHGTDAEIRLDEAYEQYKNLCDAGNTSGCIRAGKSLAHGFGVTADADAGVALLETTCTEDETGGCEALYTTLIELGRRDAVSETFERLSKRCTEGFNASCRVVADLHGAGIGTERDVERAREVYERACRISAEGTTCDKAKAIANALPDLGSKGGFDSSCMSGRASSCATAGLRAEWGVGTNEPSHRRASELYAKGCKAGDAQSCRLLYFLDEYWRWPATGSLVYTAVDGGCTAKAPQFCETAGRAIASHNWEVATRAVRIACKANRPSACLWLATNGEPAP